MDLQNASIQQLGHHIGLPVDVNLQGMTVGGVGCAEKRWVAGTVLGLADAPGQRGRTATGTYLSIKLDTPIGGREPRGILRRASGGEDRVWVDDPQRVRPKTADEVMPDGVPEEILQLARAGKKLQAIRQYRALTGATLDEAQAWLHSL